MSGEVDEVLYKLVSIEEGFILKRWDLNILFVIMYKIIGESFDWIVSLVLCVNWVIVSYCNNLLLMGLSKFIF